MTKNWAHLIFFLMHSLSYLPLSHSCHINRQQNLSSFRISHALFSLDNSDGNSKYFSLLKWYKSSTHKSFTTISGTSQCRARLSRHWTQPPKRSWPTSRRATKQMLTRLSKLLWLLLSYAHLGENWTPRLVASCFTSWPIWLLETRTIWQNWKWPTMESHWAMLRAIFTFR